MSGLRGEDVARIQAGLWVQRLIEERMSSVTEQALAAIPAPNTLALRGRLEEDLKQSLYSDPRYLRFVQWVMEARGSLASPVVIDFLQFCYHRIGVTARQRAAAGDCDATFWAQELKARLGHIEAEVHHTLPFHQVTVLGSVVQGELPIHRDDPQAALTVYQVDPEVDVNAIALEPLRGRWRKVFIAERIRYSFRGNIESIAFVSESRLG